MPEFINKVEEIQYRNFPLYTKDGYKILKLPKNLRQRLTKVWLDNRHNRISETLGEGNPYIINIHEDKQAAYLVALAQLDSELKQELETYVLDELTKWTGIDNLVSTATYGIREYSDGSILKNHLDRHDSHILSAIINVGTISPREIWPLHVENREMLAKNIAFTDGYDVILYESSSLVHGRPTPYEGEVFANLFIHYAPDDWKTQLKKFNL